MMSPVDNPIGDAGSGTHGAFSLEIGAEVPAEIRTAVESGLADHAHSAGVPTRDVVPLTAIARDADSQVIGALVGRTVWGWLHVSELWVSEGHRHAGIGRSLMLAAENAALHRGCLASYLDTFDFQATPFYQRLGYSIIGALEDFPPGHTRYFLSKRFGESASGGSRPNQSLERPRE